ncbi:MAG: hypothetical protein NTU80_06795 [Verrucomicrobia bacterium]|nr:hypothetical protein [Verrucomicrobiota bacterium]
MATNAGRADLAADLARIATEATGGAQAMAALASWRAVGETRIGERLVPFILYVARPRSVRIETVGEAGSLVRAFDGVHVPWKKADALKPPMRLGREEERLFVQEAEFDSPLYDYQARRISLDYAGEKVVGGTAYQSLLATLNYSEVTTLYLDDETHLLTRREARRKLAGRDVRMVTHYSDFRPVAGVLLPYRIRVESEGRTLHESVIESYVANPDLPKGFFSPPVADWPKL